MRLAICDDDPNFCRQVEENVRGLLPEEEGLSISVFYDGEALLSSYGQSALDECQHPYDMIMLDIEMPLLNGIEAAEEIRQINSDVVIVFITA